MQNVSAGKYNILLVDDDVVFTEELKNMLNTNGYNVVNTLTNIEDFIKYLKEQPLPDVIILDVFLGSDNILYSSKIDLFELLKDQNVIFITCSEDETIYNRVKHKENSFFIIKPFHFFTLDRIICNLLRDQAKVLIKDGRKKYYVDKNQILCFEVKGNYSVMRTPDKQFVFKKSLRQILHIFDNLDLIQVHRNYVVPRSRINQTNFREKYLVIESIKIPLSGKYKDAIIGLSYKNRNFFDEKKHVPKPSSENS